MTKGLSNLGLGPVKITHHPAKPGGHKKCGTGDMLKELVPLKMIAMEMGKKDTISIIIATVLKRLKYFIKNIFYIRKTTDKIEVTG